MRTSWLVILSALTIVVMCDDLLDCSERDYKSIGECLSGVDRSRVEILNLERNEISRIESEDLRGLVKMRHLNMGENQVDYIAKDAFIDLVELDTLTLSSNKITRLEENTFVNLKSLKTLEMNNNKLREIKMDSFAGLTSLELLDLSENEIEHVDWRAFSHLTNLITLHLSNNQIQSIDLASLSSLSKLETLELCNNKLGDKMNLCRVTDIQSLIKQNTKSNFYQNIRILKSNLIIQGHEIGSNKTVQDTRCWLPLDNSMSTIPYIVSILAIVLIFIFVVIGSVYMIRKRRNSLPDTETGVKAV